MKQWTEPLKRYFSYHWPFVCYMFYALYCERASFISQVNCPLFMKTYFKFMKIWFLSKINFVTWCADTHSYKIWFLFTCTWFQVWWFIFSKLTDVCTFSDYKWLYKWLWMYILNQLWDICICQVVSILNFLWIRDWWGCVRYRKIYKF